jgi:hypothetical protein
MRVGAVIYATEQGLGHLARDFFRAGIVQEVAIFRHGSRTNHTSWYPPHTLQLANRPFNGPKVDAFVRGVDVMLFFETPFDWSFLDYCRERGVRTAILEMYEWWPRCPPAKPDLIICPSLLDRDYFPGSPFIPIPAPQGIWKQRTKAMKFLHNAGHVGYREHKGTLELLKAMKFVKSPLTLTVRCQDTRAIMPLIDQCPEVRKDQRVTFEFGTRPYESLWDGYDVLIAPEKLNGLSLPLQEGRAAGMLVMTTDRYPTNTWLPKEPLIPVERYQRAQVAAPYLEFDEAIVRPEAVAATMDSWFGVNIEEYSRQGKAWAEENSWSVLGPRYTETLRGLLP